MTAKSKRIIWFSLLTLVIILLISAIPLKRTVDKWKVNKRIAELRELGYPMSCEELADLYEKNRPEDNGADLIIQAADDNGGWTNKKHPKEINKNYELIDPDKEKQEQDSIANAMGMPGMGGMGMPGMDGMGMGMEMGMTDDGTYPDDWKTKNLNLLPVLGDMQEDFYFIESMTDSQIALCREFINDNKTCFDALTKGLSKECLYDVDYNLGFDCLLPHLAQIRHLSKKLQIKTITDGYDNNIDLAINDIEQMYKLADTLKHDQMIIGHLVNISIRRLTNDTVGHMLSICDPSDLQLIQLQNIIKKSLENLPTFQQVMIGERAYGLDLWDISMDDIDSLMGSSTPKVFVILYRTVYIYSDKLRYINMMQEAIDSEGNAQNLDKIWNKYMDFPRYKSINTHSVAPAFAPAYILYQRCLLESEYAITALAVERYRLVNSKLPETLQELVDKDYITNIPKQPCSDKDCGYTINSSTSYEIYHFGDNKKDDGGVYDSKDRNKSDDLGIRVKR
ncbi:MAG: hypothetical protein JEZ07_15815 [Phycisphaerae bacterium]|nr:hypothetical protein [Phycisphaerae bacterium]